MYKNKILELTREGDRKVREGFSMEEGFGGFLRKKWGSSFPPGRGKGAPSLNKGK